jgi:hypothetical protein
MKRLLSFTAILGGLALMVAGTAAATASYDPSSQSWFIGRGDVIAAVGKDGLVPTTTFVWDQVWQINEGGVYADGTMLPWSYQETVAFYYRAYARLAPGNGNITGYTTGAPYYSDAVISSGTLAVPGVLPGHGTLKRVITLRLTLLREGAFFDGRPMLVTSGL